MNWTRISILFLTLLTAKITAQPIKIIWDSEAGIGVPQARISCNGNGLVANLKGQFHWPDTFCLATKIRVKAAGYFTYYGKTQDTIVLQKKPIISFEGDFVHYEERLRLGKQLLKTAIALKVTNNPDKQIAYSYESYNLDKVALSTLQPGYTPTRFAGWHRFAENTDLLLSESKTEVKHMRPNKKNEVVVAAKVSGFQDPAGALLATRYQSFNFYQDLIYSFGKLYSSPMALDAVDKYNFLVTDTLFDIATQSELYAVYFRPTKNPKFDAFIGELLINKTDYALRGVYAVPYDLQGLGLFVQQHFEKTAGDFWFPTEQQSKIEVYRFTILGHIPSLEFHRKISAVNFYTTPPFELEVPDVRLEEDTAIRFANIRPRELTLREKNTLSTIDSIGGEFLFDKKLNWVKTLSTSKIRARIIDLDIGRFVNYNYYEQVRLGAGGNTNERLFKNIQFGGWFGYSFRDQVLKYGYSTTVFFNRNKNLALTALYDFDLYEAGGTQFLASSNRLIITSNQYRRMFIRLFDRVSESRLMLSYHPLPNIHSRFFASHQSRLMLSDYRYIETENGVQTLQNGFTTSQLGFSVEWRPNDRYFQGREIMRTIKRAKPILRLQFAQSIDNLFNADFPFSRFDFEFQNQHQTLRWGLTSYEISGGLVIGDVPYPYLYTGRHNFVTMADGTRPLMISDAYAFETMRNNEFLSNAYIQVFFRHNFQKRLFKIKDWAPHLELVGRGVFGSLNNPERHANIAVRDLTRGYFEAGIEFNKIWAVFGMGFYYRMGHYAFDNPVENIVLKVNVRLAN